MISITEGPIDVFKILMEVQDRSAGATTVFTGSIRDHNDKGTVSELYYEIYKEMAEEILAEIESEVTKRWHVKKFIAIHRIGNLKVSDISVVVAVSSEHRKEAFDACRYGIEGIKSRVPIWKKEISELGALWIDGVLIKRDCEESARTKHV
jgi:molybdopterin synthase catalytic subunit